MTDTTRAGRIRSLAADPQGQSYPQGQTGARTALSPWVALFLFSMVLPVEFDVGPLRLSPYRLLLFVLLIPLLGLWLSGRAGRIRLPDVVLLLYCCWSMISYTVIHGPQVGIEAGGFVTIETMGAYLLARVFIRDTEDFFRMAQILFWIVMALLVSALIEQYLRRNLLLDLIRPFVGTFSSVNMEPRWGLRRVQSVFEHPILFGVFCSSMVAMTYYVVGYGRSLLRRIIQTALVTLAAGLSLSSGPMTAMGAQIALIGWDQVLRGLRRRWQILGGLALAALVIIDVFSNRSPAQILISFVAFRPSSAWNRLRIWEHGSASVLNNPILGIGRGDWERPAYMLSSIDMFWLVPAVRHGLPAGLLLQVAIFGVVLAVLRRKGLGPRAIDFRTGYLISLFGLYAAGWTVHYWSSVYVLLMFLLGCGACFLTPGPEPAPLPGAVPAGGRGRAPLRHGLAGATGAAPPVAASADAAPSVQRYTRQQKLHRRRPAVPAPDGAEPP